IPRTKRKSAGWMTRARTSMSTPFGWSTGSGASPSRSTAPASPELSNTSARILGLWMRPPDEGCGGSLHPCNVTLIAVAAGQGSSYVQAKGGPHGQSLRARGAAHERPRQGEGVLHQAVRLEAARHAHARRRHLHDARRRRRNRRRDDDRATSRIAPALAGVRGRGRRGRIYAQGEGAGREGDDGQDGNPRRGLDERDRGPDRGDHRAVATEAAARRAEEIGTRLAGASRTGAGRAHLRPAPLTWT